MNMFVYLGPETGRFADVFSRFGYVMQPARTTSPPPDLIEGHRRTLHVTLVDPADLAAVVAAVEALGHRVECPD